MVVITYNEKLQKSVKPLHRMVCVALREPQMPCFKFLALSSLSSLWSSSFTTLRAAIVMWKCCTVGAYSASQSVALRLVLHLWAELTCISASKLRRCTTGLACQHPSMGRLFLFHTLCLFLQHCPPQSTERFLKLALQNRKCRFSHVWIRRLVHNEDREGLDLICISLNDHSWHSLIYPSAKDLAQG